jgi:hypothetical protein
LDEVFKYKVYKKIKPISICASGGQGDSFRENRPVKHLDPLQKLLIKAFMVCNLNESMQTMTAFGSLKVKMLKVD